MLVFYYVVFVSILLVGRCCRATAAPSFNVKSPAISFNDPELLILIQGKNYALGQSIRPLTSRADSASAILNNAKDAELMKQSSMDQPWQQFIVSGPMTVTLLGQLMVVSSKLDFSFVDFSPDYKFVFMRYPLSFRATLTQIANDGWRAFLAAHSNMNKIQMFMQLIPGHIKTSLKILVGTASPQIISNLLPKTLAEIRTIGANCVKLSNSTHQTFLAVMELLGEVISITEVTRGLQETRLRQTEIELNVSRVMQVELVKLGDTIKSHYNEARESVKTAQEQYSKALKDIPTGFKALLLDFGRAIVGIISNIGNKITNGQGTAPSGGVSGPMVNSQSLAYARIFSDGFGAFAKKAKDFFASSEASTTNTANITNTTSKTSTAKSSTSSNPVEEFEAYKVTFETYLGAIAGGPSSDLKSRVSNAIQEGVDIVAEVFGLAKKTIGTRSPIDSTVSDGLLQQISTLLKNVKPLVAAEGLSGTGTPAPASSATASASTDSAGNEKFVAQMTGDRLKDAEKRYDSIFSQLKQQQEEMGKLMGKIASLNMNRINYIEILELLREALHLLSQVREQWSQLILFFAEIAARAEIALSGTLGPYIEQATQAGNAALSRDDRLFYVDLLKAQAVEIHKQSYALFIMSRTYVDMSGEFMMKRLAGLSKMLTAKTDPERKEMLMELNNDSQDTQDKVMALVEQRKAIYSASIAKRQAELDVFVASLGGPQADNQQAIDAGKDLLGLT